MLTVEDLMAELAQYPPDTPVSISPDDEGNNVHFAHGAGSQLMYKNYWGDEWSCVSEDDTDEIDMLKRQGHTFIRVLEVW